MRELDAIGTAAGCPCRPNATAIVHELLTLQAELLPANQPTVAH